MTVSAKWFDKVLINAFGGDTSGEAPNIDFLSDSIKMALFTDAVAPTQAWEFYSSVAAMTEVSATGYTAGGQALANKTLGVAGHVSAFDQTADVVWTITGTMICRYAVIYDSTPATAATQPLIWFIDFGANITTVDGTFTFTPDAGGLATCTVS